MSCIGCAAVRRPLPPGVVSITGTLYGCGVDGCDCPCHEGKKMKSMADKMKADELERVAALRKRNGADPTQPKGIVVALGAELEENPKEREHRELLARGAKQRLEHNADPTTRHARPGPIEVADAAAQAKPPATGQKHDQQKDPWNLVPWDTLVEVVKVLEHGRGKYGPWNWKKVDGRRWRYFNAMMRHGTAWWRGEKVDPESGLHHLAHLICSAMFLMSDDLAEKKEADKG